MKNNKYYICEIGVGHLGVCFSALYWDKINELEFLLFEPNPIYYEEIKKAAGDRPNVTIHNIAIGDMPGQLKLYNRETSSYLEGISSPVSQAYNDPQNDNFSLVKVETLDKFDDGNIDYLRIDTEGAEFFALKHLVSRPKTINIETHNDIATYINPYLYEIEEWMAKNSYKRTQIHEGDCIYSLIP